MDKVRYNLVMNRVERINLISFNFVLFCSVLFLSFFPTANVKAQSLLGWEKADTAATQAKYDTATETTFSGNIGFLIQAVLSMLGVVFLILMVYAGYLWMTARGEEEQISKAHEIIIAAVIGMVIVVAAYSITTFVVPKILNKTGGSGASEEVGGTKVECCKLCKTGMSGWFKTECPQKPMTEKECLSLEYKYIGLKPASECK
ncbi:MAG: hypothetical protein A2921_00810 [Candidatus Magasanikbacteria bacterium RIFCSPLOWO2_01_FULL_43_20b]|uniref:Uncharacterized protein n=1 Tax=Candidatus Magasanikbacteria bacterium RIFCSPLOWO2_12_FULL_43_12 TaxID=1798692 RepID=A0A1F6MV93_9BACT|nr:MAG: hypothetical protein A2921_00810 [Candidatus Magasanikbacteria bacterium RIFCSPLOWO2_01_FULL_43_20b]OGH75615.1 MAG: hypothetical protein A3G00_03925 [Candidatus Magasanikbacteria bacterium RIFCSPLOWO2_12_FULL_43_12]